MLATLAGHAAGSDSDKRYNDCLPPNVPRNNSLVASCAMPLNGERGAELQALLDQGG